MEISTPVNYAIRNEPVPGCSFGRMANRYEGPFKAGKMHGKGTYHYASGQKYVGEFVDNQKQGHGVHTWPNGNRYEGKFENGKMHGYGVYYYASGQEYVGEFVDGERHGQGIHSWPNGNRYEGQFRNEKMHGTGIYYYANGEKYIGEFLNDKPHSQGLSARSDTSRYVGRFTEDVSSDRGTMYSAKDLTSIPLRPGSCLPSDLFFDWPARGPMMFCWFMHTIDQVRREKYTFMYLITCPLLK